MSTGQNYVGGDSHATHIEGTVENTENTTPITPQTVSDQPETAEGEAPTPPVTPVSAQTVGNDDQPLLVPLTPYFNKVTASRANVTAFRDMLHTVFIHYATSEEFLHRTKADGDNQISILHSLNAGIAMFVERTADFRLGARHRDPGPLPGEASQPDPVVDPTAYVQFGGDVQDITDVNTLQGWVTTLQSQIEVLTRRHENEIDGLTGQLHGISETLKSERDQLAIANQKITELENRPAPVVAPPASEKPTLDYSVYMALHFGLPRDTTSEAKLVQYALREYHTSLTLLGFNAIADGEYQNAHANFRDAQVIAGLLDELTLDLIDAMSNNLAVATGKSKTSDKNDFEAFMSEFLPGISA